MCGGRNPGGRDGGGKEEMERRIERLGVEERVAAEHLNFWRTHTTALLTATALRTLASFRRHTQQTRRPERLERTNLYNDVFCIGHDGVFGTINGGDWGASRVEWSEIHAAWGQTLLLLATIARKLEYTFPAHRLVPNGSFSRIEQLSPPSVKTTHELYGSGDLHIGRLLHNRRFERAMVAFLECLRGVMEWVRAQDAGVDFPHQILKTKIGNVSVKLQFSQEDAWTRALRRVLLALEILLK
ncbi:hypothetical protein HWV62_36745 [Athelia sp. TMB]|nr:hypothetical protein HWV62_36745 [Athelia sp. TMB]